VCVTFGQTRRALGAETSEHGGGVDIPGLLARLGGLDVEVIATLNADQIPPGTTIPDNVRLFDYVPLNALLPSCAAVVHYGGMGTVNASVVHGVPQVCVPGNIWGEKGIMRALSAQGAGLVADHGNLVDQLATVLDDPSYATSAAQLAKEMAATPSPRELVGEIEEIAAGRGGTGGR
jgi:UDP:flavonoid glycosyltransferase YjiC (YdhE family)